MLGEMKRHIMAGKKGRCAEKEAVTEVVFMTGNKRRQRLTQQF